MKALVYQDGSLQLRLDYPKPEPKATEVLIRVRYAGVCRTDVELMKGYMHFEGILGHEFVGTVVACSDETLIGQAVVSEINVGCGECSLCRAGLSKHCYSRSVLGIDGRPGVFADYVCTPLHTLHVLPAKLDPLIAVFIEPVAAALQVLEDGHLQPSQPILLIGDGKLGALIAMILAAFGYDLTILGKHRDKLAHLPLPESNVYRTTMLPNQVHYPVVIEASGTPSGLRTALDVVEPRGTIILKSTYADPHLPSLAPIVIKEIRVIGSRCGPFGAAIRLLDRGIIDPRPLIEGVYPLAEYAQVFDGPAGSGLKVIFDLA